MKLADFRAKYPQYDAVDDADLAVALHKKYYASMPLADFEEKIGLSTPLPDQLQPDQKLEIPERDGPLLPTRKGTPLLPGAGRGKENRAIAEANRRGFTPKELVEEATPEELRQRRIAKLEDDQARLEQEAIDAMELEAPRTAGRFLKDRARGMLATAKTIPGQVVDVFNKDSQAGLDVGQDAAFRVGVNLAAKVGIPKAKELADRLALRTEPRSDYLESFSEQAKEQAEEHRALQSRREKYLQQGLAQSEGVLGKAAFLAKNPGEVLSLASDSAPTIAYGGVPGRLGMAAAGAKAGVTANLASQGLMSAASSSDEAKGIIRSIPNEDLAKLPEYQELAGNFRPDEIRKILEERASDQAFATGLIANAVTLGATAKLSVVERAMLGQKAAQATGTRLGNTAKAAGKEFAQEAPQGAGEQFATNIGVGSVDPSVAPTDNMLEAGFLEGVVGTGPGAAVGVMQPTASPVPKTDVEALKLARQQAKTPEQKGTLDAQIVIAQAKERATGQPSQPAAPTDAERAQAFVDASREEDQQPDDQEESVVPSEESEVEQVAKDEDQELSDMMDDAFGIRPSIRGDDGIEVGDADMNDPAVQELFANVNQKDAISEGLDALASNPDLFRSKLIPGKTMTEIAEGVDPRVMRRVRIQKDDVSGTMVHEFHVEQSGGTGAVSIFETPEAVWVDVSKLGRGKGGAESVYSAAASLALNTGRNFVEDPAGLSDDAMYRRTVQELSIILKARDATNVPTGNYLSTQRVGGPKTRPLSKENDGDYNKAVRDRALSIHHNTLLAIPEASNVRYDPDSNRFTDADGNVLSDGDLDRLADYRQANPVGSAMVRVGSEKEQLRAPAVGSNSIKVTAIIEALRTVPRGTAQSRMVGQLRRLAGSVEGLGPLRGILPSKVGQQSAPKLTVDQIKEGIVKAFGKPARRLLDSGKTRVVQNESAVPESIRSRAESLESSDGTIQGFYDPASQTTYLLADNLSDSATAQAVFLHEEGTHAGLAEMLGEERIVDLANLLKRIAEKGSDSDKAVISEALARVKKAGTPAKHVAEELVAYVTELSEQNTNPSGPFKTFLARVYSAIRQWGLKRGMTDLTVADVRQLAIGGLKHRARKAGRSTMFSSKADPRTINVDGKERQRLNSEGKPIAASDEAISLSDDSILASKRDAKPNTEPYYSALAKAMDSIPTKRASADTWKSQIKGLVNKGTVKNDEIEWSGLTEWLDLQTGVITREQIAEYLATNGVRVTETVLGGSPISAEDLDWKDVRESDLGDGFVSGRETFFRNKDGRRVGVGIFENEDGNWWGYSEGREIAEDTTEQSAINAAVDIINDESEVRPSDDTTKFAQYQLPGGKNYKELLLTLPKRSVYSVIRNDGTKRWEVVSSSGVLAGQYLSEKEANAAIPLLDRRDGFDFQSTHFDQPNILAHVRFNERIDAEGKRVLFLEEIQSDWAQEGRKIGFADAAAKKRADEITKQMAILAKDRDPKTNTMRDEKRWHELISEREALNIGGVHAAPFVGKTEAWTALALKRMISYAAENGFDKIAWTTGEQQAARYDLSKKISEVWYDDATTGGVSKPNMNAPESRGLLYATDLSGKQVIYQYVEVGKIGDYIGKEMAERLLEQPAKSERSSGLGVRRRKLSGLDLKVGGKGMKAFYDNIVPSVLKDVLRKVGGGSMETVELSDGLQQPGFRITDAIAEKASGGLPLFSKKDSSTKGRANLEVDAMKRAVKKAGESKGKRAALSSSLGINGPSGTFEYDDTRFDEFKGWLHHLREQYQAKMLTFLDAQGDIEAASGALIADSQNVWMAENLMHGRVENQQKTLEKNHIAPLKRILRKTGALAIVEDYLEARAAKSRNEDIAKKRSDMQDGGSGMLTQDAADFLNGKTDGLRSGKKLDAKTLAQVKAIVERLDAMRDETLRRLLTTGQITQAQYDAMAKNKDYAPLRGKNGKEVRPPQRHGRGIDVRGDPVKRALGRGAGNRAVNIIAEMMSDAEQSIVNGERLRVGRTLARLVLANPNPDLWAIEPVELEAKYSETHEAIYQSVKNQDRDAIRFLDKGKAYKIVLKDPRMRAAAQNLGVEQLNAFMRFLGKLNRYFSAILTRYNPFFVPLNMFRDFGMGMIGIAVEHGVGEAAYAAGHYAQALRALWREARGKPVNSEAGKALREMAAAGGLTGFTKYQNVEDIAKDLEADVKSIWQLARDGRPFKTIGRALENTKIPQLISDANESIENAIRVAAYMAERRRGSSIAKAAEYAKEITVNFNRRGMQTGFVNSIILFFNASVQGSTRVLKLLKNPRTQAAAGGMVGMQFAFAMLAMMDEDDDGLTAWEKVSEIDKMRNFVIAWHSRTEEGMTVKTIKIPMAYGFNLFPYFGGKMATAMKSGEKFEFSGLINDLATTAVDSISPLRFTDGWQSVKPQILKVFDSTDRNENDFGGRITDENPYSEYDEPRAFLGRESTPAYYKDVAKAMNWLGGGDDVTPPKYLRGLLDHSPEDLRFYTEAFGGGLLRFANQSANLGEKVAAGEDIGLSDVPVANKLYSVVTPARSTSDRYYDVNEKLARETARLRNRFYQEGEEAANDLIEKTPILSGVELHTFKSTGEVTDKRGKIRLEGDDDSLLVMKRDAKREIREIHAQMRAVKNDKTLSRSDRIRLIRELEKEREIIQRKLTVRFKEVSRV